MPQKRALLIVNPRAGRGEDGQPWGLGEGIARLENAGIAVSQPHVPDPGAIPEVIRAHRDSVDLIILGGGDGTFNRCAEAVVEAGLPVGLLPLGTANDLARTLGIPVSVVEACAVIAGGRTHQIDLGRANDVLFFNAANIGLGVTVARLHRGHGKKLFKVLAYIPALWAAYKRVRPFRVYLTIDGRRMRLRALQVSVGNGRFYGGGMTIAEGASISDQRLDVYVLRPQKFWQLAWLFPALRRGTKADSQRILRFSCTSAEVRTRKRRPVSTDGEVRSHTPAVFGVVPRALTVFVPEAALAPPWERSHAS